jgi:hypothetical protein
MDDSVPPTALEEASFESGFLEPCGNLSGAWLIGYVLAF